MEVLESKIDQSVNFVDWQDDGGAFESRYVRRTDDYFIVYLSSLTGCDRACRMCHLTQTGQTTMTSATLFDLLNQSNAVLDHYRKQAPAQKVHFNFMARGEPLSNPYIRENWNMVSTALIGSAALAGVKDVALNISTIMPTEVEYLDLAKAFNQPNTTFYYSLYSLDPKFRKRWLPKAIDPRGALNKLVRWQQATGRLVALHWAFIAGENDDEKTVTDIINEVQKRDLKVKFNAVRYNPFSDRQGTESSDLIVERNFNMLAEAFGSERSKIVPRVGKDVAASCGCFVERLGE